MAHWGVIGLGRLANEFIEGLIESEKGVLYAVSSVSDKNLKKFISTHTNVVAYSNYEDLLKDPQVDAVYISLSSDIHLKYTLAALSNNIAVLCQVPSAKNTMEFDKIVECSHKYHTIYLEGLRTRFLDSYHQLKKDITSIGKIQVIHCNVNERLADEYTYSYPIGFAMGLIDSTLMNVDLSSEEGLEMVILSFRSNCKMIIERTEMPLKSCKIIGQYGTILISDYTNPTIYTIIISGNTIHRKFESVNQLTDCINAVELCRNKGIIEHPDMTFEDTRQVIEIVNAIQRELKYEQE